MIIAYGLQAYKLDTSQSASYLEANVTETESNTVYWGIRVWKRNSAGTETEITRGTPVAQVTRSTSGYGIQSATWNCPNTTLASTDSAVFRVYCMNSGNWILQATFTTNRLNAQTANPATWTVYYWTKRNYISGGLGKTIGYFRWGNTHLQQPHTGLHNNLTETQHSVFCSFRQTRNRMLRLHLTKEALTAGDNAYAIYEKAKASKDAIDHMALMIHLNHEKGVRNPMGRKERLRATSPLRYGNRRSLTTWMWFQLNS